MNAAALHAVPPLALSPDERRRVRSAAYQVTRLLPEALGELVSRELVAFEELGYIGDRTGLSMRVVREVEQLRFEADRPPQSPPVARGQSETPEAGSAPTEAVQPQRGASPSARSTGYGSLAALWAAHRERQWGHREATTSEETTR